MEPSGKPTFGGHYTKDKNLTPPISPSRIHVFAGHFKQAQAKLAALDNFIASPTSFVNVHRPTAGVSASIIDSKGAATRFFDPDTRPEDRNPFFTFLTVFADPHTEWSLEDVPFHLRKYRDQVRFSFSPLTSFLRGLKLTLAPNVS